jgi:hypothetical protein
MDDLHTIQRSINYWNAVYGPSFASVVIPISWGNQAAAEFGRHPQESLNDQIVDDCDICIAIFANRLGTPTNSAESGTAEELQRLHDAGRYVAILRCRRLVDPTHIDLAQAQRLNDYLATIKEKSLTLDYANDAELERRVETILAVAITRDRDRAQQHIDSTVAPAPIPSPAGAEVWPRVESTGRDWKLVLVNTGAEPARNVRFDIERTSDDGSNWQVLTDESTGEPHAESLAPRGGEIRFTIIVTFGVALQVRCTVTWDDSRGTNTNTATLRLN